VGLKLRTGSIMLTFAAGQNRTKVGLKHSGLFAPTPAYTWQNRTKVGLKPMLGAGAGTRAWGKIEPRWD
jgi:hypothetical protein